LGRSRAEQRLNGDAQCGGAVIVTRRIVIHAQGAGVGLSTLISAIWQGVTWGVVVGPFLIGSSTLLVVATLSRLKKRLARLRDIQRLKGDTSF
jgi:hypothetical protein